MSEDNKAIAKRYVEEIYNQAKLDLADELLAPDYINHGGLEGQGQGPEGLKQSITALRKSSPDEHLTIVAEGDKVAYRWTARGSHKGEIKGVPPTGKLITVSGMSIIRIANGKIAEEWTSRDDLSMMQQLGLVSS